MELLDLPPKERVIPAGVRLALEKFERTTAHLNAANFTMNDCVRPPCGA